MPTTSTIWGNILYHADKDVVAFAVLLDSEQYSLAAFHGVQAIEKYMKTHYIIQLEKTQSMNNQDIKKIMKDLSHSLSRLQEKLSQKFFEEKELLKWDIFYEWSRYPFDGRNNQGLSNIDIDEIKSALKKIRKALPITVDNYPLGMFIRRKFHNGQSDTSTFFTESVSARIQAVLIRIFGKPENIVGV